MCAEDYNGFGLDFSRNFLAYFLEFGVGWMIDVFDYGWSTCVQSVSAFAFVTLKGLTVAKEVNGGASHLAAGVVGRLINVEWNSISPQ